jgi:amidase
MEKIISMPAHEVVSLLRKNKITPLELIDIAEARIQEVDGQINAVPTLCIQRAKAKAKELKASRKTDLSPNFLYGLPILVKDLTEVAGVKTTYGSLMFKDNVPSYSNYLVETLEKNGAIVIGKTNTPEFGAGGNTFNEVFGATRNPWNTAMTCGGSSGGSAAALAAGEAWLATGNDLAGSLRTPAGFCSVVGFRPSPGRIASGPSPVIFNPLGIEGPMGRCVKDVALMMDAQVGYHPGDPLSLPKPEYSFFEVANQCQKPSKIAYSVDLGGITPVEKEVAAIFKQTVETLADSMIVESACPDLKNAIPVFHTLRAAMLAHRFGPMLKSHGELFKPELVWNIEKGMNLSMDEIGEAEQMRAQIYQSVVKFFETYDLLICPTSAALPFDVSIRYLEKLEGKVFNNYIDWLTIVYAISITACPCISIPCGFSSSGLPLGLQIVGPPRRDDVVIGAAAGFEQIFNLKPLTPIDPRN